MNFIYYKLPAVMWAIIILGISSIPKSHLPEVGMMSLDKIAHAGEFGIFGLLLYRYYLPVIEIKKVFQNITLIGFGLACIDEAHQFLIPGRTPDMVDVGADAFGIVISLMIINFILVKKTN